MSFGMPSDSGIRINRPQFIEIDGRLVNLDAVTHIYADASHGQTNTANPEIKTVYIGFIGGGQPLVVNGFTVAEIKAKFERDQVVTIFPTK